MSNTIRNIGLYLSARHGSDTDYQLVLCVYDSDHTTGLPVLSSLPHTIAERNVDDIDHDGWYVFDLPYPMTLTVGHYSIVLYQRRINIDSPVDFDQNFVGWIHSEDTSTLKDILSFSSVNDLSPADSYAYSFSSVNVYGYGYDYGIGSDYYDVLGILGTVSGEGIPDTLGYGYGYESVYLQSNRYVTRSFKLYNQFNDITSISTDNDYIQVNLPSAEESTLTLDNRQDFIDSTKTGTSVWSDSIVLSDFGGRSYVADSTDYDLNEKTVKWYEANRFLPSNDINSADITCPSGETSQYRQWMAAAPYFSGVYFSVDSGSIWRNRSTGLQIGNSYRNFSCVVFSPDSSFILGFDDTSDAERGNVYKAYITRDQIINNDISWSYISRITDHSGNGLKVNSAIFWSASQVWAGTDNGVYVSTDIHNYGYDYESFGEWLDTGLSHDIQVHQIVGDYDPLYEYGYGYGYGEGLDYFDVLGIAGYLEGYGIDSFETLFSYDFGSGYGWERIFGLGDIKEIFIATDQGCYEFNGGVWNVVGDIPTSTECYSIHVTNNKMYVGTTSGIIRSVEDSEGTGTGFSVFYGDDPLHDFYPHGLLEKRTTFIASNFRNESEIYVAQYGGIFISKNDGGNFNFVSGFLPEKRIKTMLLNPIDNRMVHVFTETNKFSQTAVTFLIDCSGSMDANDPEGTRIELCKKIVSDIIDSNSEESYFQIITFGLGSQRYNELWESSLVENFPGVQISSSSGSLTGFLSGSNLSSINLILDACDDSQSHLRTPLWDAVDVTVQGLNKAGVFWEYDNVNKRYSLNENKSKFYSELRKVLIVITDGHETVPSKTAEEIIVIKENISKLRAQLYVVGVGHDINYTNLLEIKNSHDFSNLIVIPFVFYQDEVTPFLDNQSSVNIGSGSNLISINLEETMSNTDYTVIASIQNSLDGDPSKYMWIITEKTTSSFSVLFSEEVDSDNYVFEWAIVPSSNTIKNGTISLTNGTDTQSVTFATTFDSDSYSLILTLENIVDISPSLYSWIIDSKTSSGFSVEFSDTLDSTNYVLSWTAVESSILYGEEIIEDDKDSVYVEFSSPLDNANYLVSADLENETDLSPSKYTVIIINKSKNGFSALFSGSTDSANYVLNWTVIPLSTIDIADSIVSAETGQNRTGKWKKIISYDTRRILKESTVSAVVPYETSCTYRTRSSEDKETWSSWSTSIAANSSAPTSTLDMMGKYFEIEISLFSSTSKYSPDVNSISFVTYTPKESFIYYNELSESDNINEMILSSNDSISRGDITEDQVKVDFFYLDSNTYDIDSASTLHRNKVSSVSSKEKDYLYTYDGYFYYTNGGVWAPGDYYGDDSISLYGLNGKRIDSKLYYSIPSLGAVVFYESQKSGSSYKDYYVIYKSSSQYRVGSKLINYKDTASINFYDIAWMYHVEGTTETPRTPIAYAESQIDSLLSYGKVRSENYASREGLSTTFLVQYIVKDNGDLSSGNLEFTTGQNVILETSSDGTETKENYNNNAYLSKFNIDNIFDDSFVSVFHGNRDSGTYTYSKLSGLTVSLVGTGNYNSDPYYKVVADISSLNINTGDHFDFIVGDNSTSGALTYRTQNGIPTSIFQNNLLFGPNDSSYGEIETRFLFDVDGTSNFYHETEPAIRFCGLDALKLVVLAPSTVKQSEIFSFNILAVDALGLIDRTYTGTVDIWFSPVGFGTLNSSTLVFDESDRGVKSFSAFITSSSDNRGTIKVRFNGQTDIFTSNTIEVVGASDFLISWGDPNVSTLLSDGRQDIDFIADYCKNISNIDFVTISDDLNILENHSKKNNEWNYIKNKSEELSSDGFYIFPGFTHRSSDLYGERVFMFKNLDNLPSSLPTSPESIGISPEDQITGILSSIESSNYISIPVRSPYKYLSPDDTTRIFKDRGFSFDNYQKMVAFSSDVESFISDDETISEIYSEHGFCEDIGTDSSTNSKNFDQNSEKQYIQYALQIGKKFGFTAGSGGYASRPGYYTGDQSDKTNSTDRPNIQANTGDIISNKGLTAVLVSKTAKDNIFSALKSRRCYATTGARIYLDVTGQYGSSSKNMGDTFYNLGHTVNNYPDDDISINIKASSDKSFLREIRVYRVTVDNLVEMVKKYVYGGAQTTHVDFTFNDDQATCGDASIANKFIYSTDGGKEICYYIRVKQDDRHVAWSSPIWYNFGRTDGIQDSESSVTKSIREPIITTKLKEKEFFGSFSSSSNQNSPLYTFSLSSEFPDGQKNLMYNIKSNTTTRKTYDNAHLYISDNVPEIWGTRILSDSNGNVIYGTHYLRFLYDSSDKSANSLAYTDSTGPNGNNMLNSGEIFKYSSNWGPYNSTMNPSQVGYAYSPLQRNKLFGYVWQYSNISNIEDGYLLDNIFYSSSRDVVPVVKGTTGDAPIIKDPFMIYRDDMWHLVYVIYDSSNYPSSVNKDYNADDISEHVVADGRVEDFAGLLESNGLNNFNFKMAYTNTEGQTIDRDFINTQKVIFENTYNGNQISYISSPNLLKLTSGYALYYIGWLEASLTVEKPIMCMFRHTFQSLEDYLIGDADNNTDLCFIFSNEQSEYFSNYFDISSIRKSSCQTQDLFWNSFRSDQISTNVTDTTGWATAHPAYSLGFSWLSVIKYDDGVYYAFYNKNRIRDFNGDLVSGTSGGTGILYSTDGINFYEFDQFSNKITDLTNKIYCHPFVYNGRWYISYRDSSDLAWPSNNMGKIKYSAINWRSIQNFSPVV